MQELTPEEAVLLRDLFERIAGAPWFNRNVITERELIKLIMELRRDGNHADLEGECTEAAKARFSRA